MLFEVLWEIGQIRLISKGLQRIYIVKLSSDTFVLFQNGNNIYSCKSKLTLDKGTMWILFKQPRRWERWLWVGRRRTQGRRREKTYGGGLKWLKLCKHWKLKRKRSLNEFLEKRNNWNNVKECLLNLDKFGSYIHWYIVKLTCFK